MSSCRTQREVLPHPHRRPPLTGDTDDETAAALNAGAANGSPALAPDPAELNMLFERLAMPFIDRLYAAAVQMTRDRGEAEDLIQETYRRAFDAFGSFAWKKDLRMWLFRLLADTALEACAEPQTPVRPSSSPGRTVDRLPETTRPTLQVSQTAQAWALGQLPEREVKAALRQLPRNLAIVVHLADVEDFSRMEIAEILRVPPSTVKLRLHYGRRCLRGLLTDVARRHGLLSRTGKGSAGDSAAP
ncbi:sigma-70 family RNA polymerase sigma factor [Streptomyces sp. NPDC001621]|uniref:sigma-70 family RNA polymerase sigma factor n=1 Tax=Streptomyces sp. NPDC001621 TaxID=3364594 RepID=UPI003674824C